MSKVMTLRNIIACCCAAILIGCKNENEDFVYGQWQVQSLSSTNSYVSNMADQNYSLNINESSADGSVISVSDGNGLTQDASIKYKSGDNMIVEYSDPQTGQKMLVQMKKN